MRVLKIILHKFGLMHFIYVEVTIYFFLLFINKVNYTQFLEFLEQTSLVMCCALYIFLVPIC